MFEMLYLVGLGLWDEKDISLRGLEIAKRADKIYLEAYTSYPMGLNMGELETLIGKQVVELSRNDVEVSARFLDEAMEEDVVVLVGGDPLVATTHSDVIVRARQKGVNVRVIHNASIVSAIAETGLHIYKFGQTVTIPFWTKNFKPTSFYDRIIENMGRGLHTLVLLDIDRENKRYMTANEAIQRLAELDGGKHIKQVIVVARLGSPNQIIRFGHPEELVSMDFGGPLHALVIPGELHVSEKEYIESIRAKPLNM